MNTQLAKCSCQHCGGHLEFEIAYAGERVACPHCGNETCLCVPVEATALGAAYSPPVAPEPAVQSAYPAANQDSAPPAGRRPQAARSPGRPPQNTKPFARRAAADSCICVLLMFGCAYLGRHVTGPMEPVLGVAAVFFLVIGFALGIIALFGIRKHGTRGILIPAFFGTAANGVLLVMLCVIIHARWVERRSSEPGGSARSVNRVSSTKNGDPMPVARPSVEKKLPRTRGPTITVLQPGTEPRRLLRFQPKVGDKQTVAFTLKMSMEPGPFRNLPPIKETTEIKIRNVSANGDIAYERVVTDVSMLPASAPTSPLVGNLKPAFSTLKGLTTSGLISSRGFAKRTETKSPKMDQALPAVARLYQGQMEAAVHNILLPQEPVGAGGKWEIRQDPGGVQTYEVVSIESDRVVARTKVTESDSKMAIEGSGEMTIDLARLVPMKANLVHRMEGSEPGGPGGTNLTVKIRGELLIEAK